jgi:hypothetical protein
VAIASADGQSLQPVGAAVTSGWPSSPQFAVARLRSRAGAANAKVSRVVLVRIWSVWRLFCLRCAPEEPETTRQAGAAAGSSCARWAFGMVRHSPQPSGTRAQALTIR